MTALSTSTNAEQVQLHVSVDSSAMWPESRAWDGTEYKALQVQDLKTGDDQVENHTRKQSPESKLTEIRKVVCIPGHPLILGLTL